MNTRGAPAIAITGCLALAVELTNVNFDLISALDQFVTEKLGLAQNFEQGLPRLDFHDEILGSSTGNILSLSSDYLVTARPTAVNMNEAAVRFKKVLSDLPSDLAQRKEKFIELLEDMLRLALKLMF